MTTPMLSTTAPRLLASAGPPGNATLSTISFEGEGFAVTTGAVTTMIPVPEVVDHLLAPLDVGGTSTAFVVLADEGGDACVAIAVHRSSTRGWIDARTGAALTDDDLRAEVLSLFTVLVRCSEVSAGRDETGTGDVS